MGFQMLTFTPLVATANDHPNTMMLMVDEEAFQKYKSGDKSISLVQIVSSFEVCKFQTLGNDGAVATPSNTEKLNAFGTKNETEIVEFMLQHGSLHIKHNGKPKQVTAPESDMEKLLNADRRAY